MEQEEQECVAELATFTAEEVQSFIKTYRPMLTGAQSPPREAMLRLIAVALLLKRRATSLRDEFLNLRDDESFNDNGATTVDLQALVKNCADIIRKGCDAWLSWHGTFDEMLEYANKSNLFQNTFSRVFKEPSIACLTSDRFRGCIYQETESF